MSLYYKQNFVSAEPIWAEVKETLRSYFASGAIDDVMFPKWTEHCLRRFRKSSKKIKHTMLEVKNFKAQLPDDFDSVREAWMCVTTYSNPVPCPSSLYYQTDCRLDVPERDKCDPCFETDTCTTEFMVVHKVTGHHIYTYARQYLLKPGNIHAKSKCGEHCGNLHSSSSDTFDIQGCNFITNFCDATVDLLYYGNPDEDGETMIPENFWVEDYVRKFLIYKCLEQLSHIVTDETFNQIERKKMEAKADQAEAYILADIELKKQTVHDKVRSIRQSYNRFNKYRLPGDPSDSYGG